MIQRAAAAHPGLGPSPPLDGADESPGAEEPAASPEAHAGAHAGAHAEAHAEVVAEKRRFGDSLRSFFIQLVLFGLGLLGALGVFARAVTAPTLMRSSFERLLFAAGVALLPALPLLLTLCLSRMVTHALDARVEYGRTATFEAHPGRRRGADAWIVRSARRLWHHEAEQVTHASTRMREHAAFYGFVASAALSIVTMLLIAPAVAQTLDNPGHDGRYRVPIALAVGSAVAIAFLRDTGRMLVRAAHRDSSTPMFAWATRRLLLLISSTLLLCCMAFFSKDLEGLIKGATGWVLLGAAMAILGDRAVDAVDNRAARLLGVAPQRTRDEDDLRQIEGLGEDDRLRLAEEGVDSVHTLAFQWTPKLFFSTPYALHRICDWQDQCLLLVRLGPSRARMFREQLGIRGAIDASHAIEDILALPEGDEDAGDLMRMLGFPGDTQGRVALERIACDEGIARLEVFQRAIPGKKPEGPTEVTHAR
ncbi:MAG: hypothetical protein U0359_09250 [Byssovorax sp.]